MNQSEIHDISSRLITIGSKNIVKRPSFAISLIKKGLIINPRQNPGWYNLGICLHNSGKIQEAIRSYSIEMSNSKEYKGYCLENISYDLFLLKNYKEAWALYEKRPWMKYNRLLAIHLKKQWLSYIDKNNLPHKLFITTEQGFGDTLQFLRFAIYLEKKGVKVILICQKQLVELIEKTSLIHKVIGGWDPTINENPADQIRNMMAENNFEINSGVNWIPLLSIPKLLNWNKKEFPLAQGYLETSFKKYEVKNRLSKKLKRKKNHKLIGIYWQGNAINEQSIYSQGRSMPFKYWEILSDYLPKNVEFISLQKGDYVNQWKSIKGIEFVDGQSDYDGDTSILSLAQVILGCDLIVTTDSLITHLSGALGVKTFLALKYVPDWRWGINGESNDWYSSVKLFRQAADGQWDKVMHTIGNEISKLNQE